MKDSCLKILAISLVWLSAGLTACSSPPKPPMPSGDRIPINAPARSTAQPATNDESTTLKQENEALKKQLAERPACKE